MEELFILIMIISCIVAIIFNINPIYYLTFIFAIIYVFDRVYKLKDDGNRNRGD